MPEPTAPEPSMDEILASIRKIITDDGPSADADGMQAEEPAVAEAPAPAGTPPDEPLTGDPAATATASSFERLSAEVDASDKAKRSMAMPPPGRSLEDVTTDLLRPLLKAWLDEHLPAIVQDRVDEEVARIARSRVR
ncbi:MAG: DUF2497 domain-containing protein [Caulobacteraceae bacterium]|nr:DUF2497 domain-containing protein [Caulobacteraceae bacterium]